MQGILQRNGLIRCEKGAWSVYTKRGAFVGSFPDKMTALRVCNLIEPEDVTQMSKIKSKELAVKQVN